MNRPKPGCALLACALFAFASAALCAQQSSQSSPYSGTSAPPPDDTIESSEPQPPQPPAKPHPGQPMNAQPAAPAPAPAAPQRQPYANPPAYTDPNAGTDAGMVQGAPSASDPAWQPAQPGLSNRSMASDPDGDIVHPDPLPP